MKNLLQKFSTHTHEHTNNLSLKVHESVGGIQVNFQYQSNRQNYDLKQLLVYLFYYVDCIFLWWTGIIVFVNAIQTM